MKINLSIDPDKESKMYIRKFVERKAMVIAYNKEQADKIIDLLHKLGYQWHHQGGIVSYFDNNSIIAFYGLNKGNYKNGGIPQSGNYIAMMGKTNLKEQEEREITLQPTFFLENFEKYYKDED